MSWGRTAIVHDWLTFRGGAEKALEALLSIYPDAPVFTLVYNPALFQASPIGRAEVRTSFLQRLPGARRHYRTYLPLMPLAIEQFDLAGYDLVISLSDAVAHGVLTAPDQLHVNYIFTPMRYAWPLYHDYLRSAGLTSGPRSWAARLVLHYLRQWDRLAADRVDRFIAISKWVARRVKTYYRREAQVVYPPVDVEQFNPISPRGTYYITVSRLVPYKRVDMIIEAFNQLDRPLIVVGEGPEGDRLEALAGPNVELLGRASQADLIDLLGRARAFVYAAEEDFGIAPVEAMAAGCPVIAYGRGGILESVEEGVTGLFFPEASSKAIVAAVERFEQQESAFKSEALREASVRFSRENFERSFQAALESAWEDWRRESQ